MRWRDYWSYYKTLVQIAPQLLWPWGHQVLIMDSNKFTNTARDIPILHVATPNCTVVMINNTVSYAGEEDVPGTG